MIVVTMIFSIFGIWVLGLSIALPHHNLTRFRTLCPVLSRDNIAPSGERVYIGVLSLAYDLTDAGWGGRSILCDSITSIHSNISCTATSLSPSPASGECTLASPII